MCSKPRYVKIDLRPAQHEGGSEWDDESEFEEDDMAIVVDNGSATTKAGFAGDDAPQCVFPTIVDGKNIGDEVILKDTDDEKISVCHPIKHGYIQDWDGMEQIWKYTFDKQLGIITEDYMILLTDSALNPNVNREKKVQIMFETFNFRGTYFEIQETLSMYSSGRTTGITMNCGYNAMRVAPIYEGYALPHAISVVKFGGNDINKYMKELFAKKDINFSMNEIEKLKTKYAYICQNGIKNELERASCSNPDWLISAYLRDIHGNYAMVDVESICSEYIGDKNEYIRQRQMYKLPDGKIIDCTDEICQSAELLFDPQFIGKEDDGIDKMMHSSIMKVDVDVRRDLYQNIVVSGGTSLICGMTERLKKEVDTFITDSYSCNVIAPPERLYSSWIGGSILSSLSTFREMWISKDEYDESGPRCVRPRHWF